MKRCILVCLLAIACHDATPIALRIDAAKDFTRQCKRKHVPEWPLDAHAAGSDCDVLVIEARVPLDSRMIETIHYASPNSRDEDVQTYAKRTRFRGVAYKDSLGRYWTYGTIAKEDAPMLQACH